MRTSKSSLALGRIAFLVLAVSIFAATAFATAEKVVYSFLGTPDGLSPQASLVADSAGNLYGTTPFGGTGINGPGVVFELSPPATSGGAWTEAILHNFDNAGTTGDGVLPYGTLLLDKAGNLYGTTELGGAYNGGTIFELSPPTTPGGAWTEAVLWSFQQNGAYRPYGKLVMDAQGNLYGTNSINAIFELVAPTAPGGPWTETVLYEFQGGNGANGTVPGPDLLLRNGIIYATGQIGGAGATSGGNGTVFQLAGKGGVWTITLLHAFSMTDGMLPYGGLIADGAGNLYGTTVNGGDTTDCLPLGCGTVYELSPPVKVGDPWQFTTIHIFKKNGDGANPWGALWRDKLGNLYGTTYAGGTNGSNLGMVFKLKPPTVAGGAWTYVALHTFRGLPGDGANPHGGLILHNGVLYGTTVNGGKRYLNSRTGGAVFGIVP